MEYPSLHIHIAFMALVENYLFVSNFMTDTSSVQCVIFKLEYNYMPLEVVKKTSSLVCCRIQLRASDCTVIRFSEQINTILSVIYLD